MALREQSAEVVSFQRLSPSFPPTQNVNSAALAEAAARHFGGILCNLRILCIKQKGLATSKSLQISVVKNLGVLGDLAVNFEFFSVFSVPLC